MQVVGCSSFYIQVRGPRLSALRFLRFPATRPIAIHHRIQGVIANLRITLL